MTAREWIRAAMDWPRARGKTPVSLLEWLERRANWSWRRKLTPAGRVLLFALLVCGTVSPGVTMSFPLYYWSIFLLIFPLVGRVSGLLFTPRVTLERDLPERCAAGATLRIGARVRNRGRLPVFDLGATEFLPPSSVELEKEPQYLDCLPPGESATLPYTLRPRKRGSYTFLGPAAMTGFPFGLYNHTRSRMKVARMLVYPAFHPLERLAIPVGRRYQPGGLQLVSHVGDSEEFLGNREYRPGDRLRDIHYTSWARVGFPVVREFQEEYLCRIALAVDTFPTHRGRKARRALEAVLSLGAAVADALNRQEYVIDLFAAGPELYHFQAGRSLAYLDNILDILACLEPCDESPFASLSGAILEEIREIGTAVVILLDWTPDRAAFVRALRQAGAAVKLILVRDGPCTMDPAGAWDGATPLRFRPGDVEGGIARL